MQLIHKKNVSTLFMAIYQHAMERGIITSSPNMLNAHYSAIWYYHDSFFALSFDTEAIVITIWCHSSPQILTRVQKS